MTDSCDELSSQKPQPPLGLTSTIELTINGRRAMIRSVVVSNVSFVQ